MTSRAIIASRFVHPQLGVVFRTKGGSMYKHVHGPGKMGRRVHLHRGVHPQHGSGFFDSIGNFFTKTLPGAVIKAAPYVNTALKATGILGKAAGGIPVVGPVAGALVKAAGYGARKRKAAPRAHSHIK